VKHQVEQALSLQKGVVFVRMGLTQESVVMAILLIKE